jgi:hypothetical protein
VSSFEVDDTHIDVLVSAALQKRDREHLRWYHGDVPSPEPGVALGAGEAYMAALQQTRREVTRDTAGHWGAVLVAANKAAVNYRYDNDEIEEAYEFTEYAGTFSPVAILRALDCYEYQACDDPAWAASEAWSFCNALRRRTIRDLAGYSEAAYEISDARQAGAVGPARMSVQDRRRWHESQS